jgi:hypothetical protein
VIKYFFVCFLIFCSLQFAQGKSSEKIDSLRIQNKYNVLLNPNFDMNLNMKMRLNDFAFNYGDLLPGQANMISSIELSRIKNIMNQSFAVYRAGQNKYHLGVVSDVLGYVGTAAAAGFAAYHLYKYKKEYGIK